MMAVPYAFRDSEHLHAAVNGDIGAEIEAQITERTNLVPLAWFERGPRELTSNRPIRHPDDLSGESLMIDGQVVVVRVRDGGHHALPVVAIHGSAPGEEPDTVLRGRVVPVDPGAQIPSRQGSDSSWMSSLSAVIQARPSTVGMISPGRSPGR